MRLCSTRINRAVMMALAALALAAARSETAAQAAAGPDVRFEPYAGVLRNPDHLATERHRYGALVGSRLSYGPAGARRLRLVASVGYSRTAATAYASGLDYVEVYAPFTAGFDYLLLRGATALGAGVQVGRAARQAVLPRGRSSVQVLGSSDGGRRAFNHATVYEVWVRRRLGRSADGTLRLLSYSTSISVSRRGPAALAAGLSLH